MKKNIQSLLIFFLFFTGVSVAADETYLIGTFPIPLMVEDKDNGIFIELTKEIAKRSKIKITIKVLPPKRITTYFAENILHGFFPALDVMVTHKISKSESIYIKKDFGFTKQGQPLVKSITDLTGKHIGMTLGYPYSKEITANLSFTTSTAPSDINNIIMLDAGHIDVFVVEEKSGLKAIEQSGKNNISYDSEQPLSRQNVYYAFQSDKTGQRLALLFSKALVEMKNDGTFENIMSKVDE
ncbi:transporter substrate-binding domain-containing protein [Shewanella psychropiezotolerans]|uniref:Transporter substrate-binding domain-containing protein n=1 Tax=Shewanella psychropiezotolerans TaxID=2593655 RepID=A0ABX5X571_9GAMM|nr:MULTISPECIES: transporter substrate-binding domain-containing protein [Shewanella]MPY23490.1 transporter substrate-binding domain-containing protein [Shewanella sp. YLB-07]QDO85567.1 transporter substrate-binding domain-containing protein [Shewanella psychropiezotolerans]